MRTLHFFHVLFFSIKHEVNEWLLKFNIISDYELIFHNHDSLQRSESIWADRPAPAALVDAAAKVSQSQNFLADFWTKKHTEEGCFNR